MVRVLIGGMFCCWMLVAEAQQSTFLLPDPTAPLQSQQGTASAGQPSAALPVLQSIFYGGSVRRAIMNGRGYQEGSMVGQYKVLAIRVDHVVLEGADGTKHTLKLFSYRVRYK